MRVPYRQPIHEEGAGLEVSELHCGPCGRAMPIRKVLLIVLPEGDKHAYLCARCGETLATKIEPSPPVALL